MQKEMDGLRARLLEEERRQIQCLVCEGSESDDKPFFMGDRPTSVDATVAGLLYALLCLEVDTPLIRHTRAIPTFAAYVVRFEQTVFPGATQIPAHLATQAETTA